MAMIYRQPVEAMETANVALSGNGGVIWDKASSEQCVVRCGGTTNKRPDVVRILCELKMRSLHETLHLFESNMCCFFIFTSLNSIATFLSRLWRNV